MGHANISNISHFVIRYLYAKGNVSIDDFILQMHRKGETLHASEGEYDDYGMMGYGVEEVIGFHRDNGVIEPVNPTPEELALLKNPEKLADWDFTQSSEGFGFASESELTGSDPPEPQVELFPTPDRYVDGNRLWALFYNIKWRFCKGQRNRYKQDGQGVLNYDHVESITN